MLYKPTLGAPIYKPEAANQISYSTAAAACEGAGQWEAWAKAVPRIGFRFRLRLLNPENLIPKTPQPLNGVPSEGASMLRCSRESEEAGFRALGGMHV